MSLTWQRTTVAESCKLKAGGINKKLVSQSSVTKNSAAEQNHLASCRNASASEVPQHRTMRMTRSHAPFAQTFPSANKNTTTKRPQTSRACDFKETFCIQKFRDMSIYSLDFKTKFDGTILNGTMIPVVFFVPLLKHFNENVKDIFFSVLYITQIHFIVNKGCHCQKAIFEIPQTTPTETWRSARNVKDT